MGKASARGFALLSVRLIESLKQPGLYADGGCLYLWISKTGRKRWVFRYRRGKKQTDLGLGPLHVLTLAGARAEAHQCRQWLFEGKRDPAHERKAATRAAEGQRVTLGQCCDSTMRWWPTILASSGATRSSTIPGIISR